MKSRRIKNPRAVALSALISFALFMTGCSSVSGVGGSGEFSCSAGKGVPCGSISGNSANLDAGNLPFQRADRGAGASEGGVSGDGSSGGAAAEAAATVKRQALNYYAPKDVPTAAAAQPGRPAVSPSVMVAPSSGVPLRTPERVLRVWWAPVEDANGTFADQRYTYFTVQQGRWLIQANRENVKDQPRVIRNVSPAAPAARTGMAPPKDEAAALAQSLGQQPPQQTPE